ncbi:hypothetical protein FA13DRAFT_1091546 [Coprinellus micaceus]|uniref:Uncharacterized protein n=1 Tax=Coprinellus micaceus TaxID=71717 RepID=A0A4Y7TS14_COPMI|nr:hypothetical protein FA13DRAFT_1091546 [Coprinellus micaceus]
MHAYVVSLVVLGTANAPSLRWVMKRAGHLGQSARSNIARAGNSSLDFPPTVYRPSERRCGSASVIFRIADFMGGLHDPPGSHYHRESDATPLGLRGVLVQLSA